MDVKPEKERWRQIAREWYGAGLVEQPVTGKLHHHLGLLEREVEDEELRGCYHFAKSHQEPLYFTSFQVIQKKFKSQELSD
jgi:protein SMG6